MIPKRVKNSHSYDLEVKKKPQKLNMTKMIAYHQSLISKISENIIQTHLKQYAKPRN
jgi:hypothetical protein